MAKLNTQILELIKSCSKDSDSESKIKSLLEEIIQEHNCTQKYLSLLESAIKNDYDSILITELTLTKPGPKIVYVNDGFTKMTGYTREEVIGKTPRILQGEKTDRKVLDRLKKRLIEGQAFFGHTVNYRKDGTEFINQWDIHPLTNSDGEITHWVSYQRDITERDELSKVLFNANINFENLVEESKKTFVDLDVQGNIITSNRSFRDTIGVENEALKEVKIWDLVSRNHKEELQNLFEDFDINNVSEGPFVWEFTHESGEPRELEARVKCFNINEESIIRVSFDNISLRNKVIKTLEKKTKNLKSLLDTHEEFCLKFKKNKNGEIYCSYVSDTFQDIVGNSNEEVLEKGIEFLLSEDSKTIFKEHLNKAFSGVLCSEKCVYVGSDDEKISVIQSFKPIFDKENEEVKAVKSVALLELEA